MTQSTQALILAIDQGGQSSRVAVYNCNGEQLYCFSAPCTTKNYQPENSVQNFIEQDGEEILNGIKNCLQKIQLALGDDIRHVRAAGFAGQGSSLLCWDNQTGAALTPVLSWQDIRGELILKNIPISHEQVQAITGLRLSPHYGASKIRWCIENYPAVAQALENNRLSIGPIVSYIFWHLLQKKNIVDPGHAQRTLLWNLENNNWDQSLLDLFNIPKSVLPECLFHNSHFGYLMLGHLFNGYQVPFSASARDQGASLFAQGLPDQSACYVNIGTGAFIQRVSENLNAPKGLLVSPLLLSQPKIKTEVVELASPTCYAAEFTDYVTDVDSLLPQPLPESLYAWEATVNGAASAISFLQQCTGLNITPEEINKAVALNPAQDCYFLNAVGGLSAPYWRTDLQSQFSEHLSPYEKILAWIESVIFQIVVNIELMNISGNPPSKVQKIVISGGLSNADAICQKIADLTQTQVHRSNNTDATLQGIAYLAAGMPREWQPQQGDDIFTPHKNIQIQSRFKMWKVKMTDWLQ